MAQSAVVKVPAVIGYFRPVVLIPLSVASGFPPEQLEALLAHELAHIRRHDYLVNLLQTAVETLCFYHPAVWWISSQIRCEREDCCDDVALSVCRNQTEYARGLVALEELRGRVPATALAAVGGSLLSRIRRIAGVEDEPRPGLGAILSAAAVVSLVALAGLPTRSAETTDGPPPPFPHPSAATPKPAESDDGKFRVTLPDGAVFELVGVNEYPSTGKTWWRADGLPLANIPGGQAQMNFTTPLEPKSLLRDFAVETSLAEDVACFCFVNPRERRLLLLLRVFVGKQKWRQNSQHAPDRGASEQTLERPCPSNTQDVCGKRSANAMAKAAWRLDSSTAA